MSKVGGHYRDMPGPRPNTGGLGLQTVRDSGKLVDKAFADVSRAGLSFSAVSTEDLRSLNSKETLWAVTKQSWVTMNLKHEQS